eukprot:m.65322 g.65322  ORF g.65322 m.65322 type:complete len:325 (-) comp8147_c0_seq2:1173-2147(-)
MGWSDDIAIGLTVCGAISILSSIWIIIVIIASRGTELQPHRFLIHLSISNIGYAVYWVLPRFDALNIIVERFGGAKDQCNAGTFCANNVCYFQGGLWFLSYTSLFWEMFLVCYAAYCCLKETKGISTRTEIFWGVLVWLIGMGLGGAYIGVCVSDGVESYLAKSKQADRVGGFIWIGVVFFSGILCSYLYFGKIKTYLHEVYISLFPDGANSLFWSDVQRKIRQTLYQVRFKEIVSMIRPVVFYPFAFLLLTIPMIVYLSWSEASSPPPFLCCKFSYLLYCIVCCIALCVVLHCIALYFFKYNLFWHCLYSFVLYCAFFFTCAG